MTLILKLELDMVKMQHHTKNEVSMSTHSKVIAWTDKRTDRQTQRKHRVTIPCKRSFDFTWNLHEIQRISGEIHPKPYKIRCFSKNSSDFIRFGGGFHLKSAGFHHEIRRISRISWWKIKNVSFCVMIKYRSFFRKTKHYLYRILGR